MTTRRIFFMLLASLGGYIPVPVEASPEPRRIDVEEAVRLALRNDPRVRTAHARANSADDTALSSRGHFLPAIRLSEEFQHWDSAYALPFDLTPFVAFYTAPAFQKLMLTPPKVPPSPGLKVRDQNTNSFVASADEPLLGLLRIAAEHSAASRSAEATRAAERTVEAALREGVQAEYLGYFAARAAEDIAKASEEQLAEQVRLAQVRLRAGVITNADVLRLQVAVANARQQQIQAQTQQAISRASLLSVMGIPLDDEGVDLLEPTGLLGATAEVTPAFPAARDLALANRPELSQARLAAQAARSQDRARHFALLPDVDLEGAYIRTDGSLFNPPNAGFVGIKASWAIWEWGASWYAARAAAEQADAVAAQADDAQRQVTLDVATRLAQARAAHNAVEVASTTITSAEEAFRVTDALVKAGSATTTDLLDAQQALTQARLYLARARYDEALVRVQIARAVGR